MATFILSNNSSGWSATQGDAVGADFTVISMTYNVAGNATLRLEYRPKTYTVTYELSFADGSRINASDYRLELDTNNIACNELDGRDGSVDYKYYTQEYDFGETITAPVVAIYGNSVDTSHYVWSGWAGLPAEMPDKPITVTGKFTSGQYTYRYVIYDADGNPTEYYKEGSDGSADMNLLKPQSEGYAYSGWSYEIASMAISAPDSAITIFSNQTLPAMT
jgi:hypothetical protein